MEVFCDINGSSVDVESDQKRIDNLYRLLREVWTTLCVVSWVQSFLCTCVFGKGIIQIIQGPPQADMITLDPLSESFLLE